MSEHENNKNGFIPLKFTPLTFETSGTQHQRFNSPSPRVNHQPSGMPLNSPRVLLPSPSAFSRPPTPNTSSLNSGVTQSHANAPPFSPRVLFPLPSRSSTPVSTSLPSGSSQTYSGPSNKFIPPRSPRVLFPQPPSDSALFSAINEQQLSTPKVKSDSIEPSLQQVQQNVQKNINPKDEKGSIESQLQEMSNRFQLLTNSNEKLMESFHHINEEIQDVKRISQESKNGIGDANKALEEVGKDRSIWISQMQEFQRHTDKRVELMQADFQRKLDEKETQMDSLRSRADQLLSQLGNMTAERDSTKQKLNETTKELDQVLLDKARIFQERNQVEMEKESLTQSFKNMLNERVNKVVEELSEEQSRSQAILQELNDCRDKIIALQMDHQKTLSDMEELSLVDQQEIASLKENIAKLNVTKEDISSQLVAAEEKLAFQQQTITTFGDIKVALASVSKERASLQERYTALEAQLVETEEKLACSVARKVELEQSVEDFNRQMQDNMEVNNQVRQQVDELSLKLTAANATIEEKLGKITELENQLVSANDSVREMQNLLEMKAQSSKEMETQLEDCSKIQIEYEKQIADLKRDLMGNSIQLTYKEKRISELEDALKNLQAAKSESEIPDPKMVTELEKTKKRLQKKTLELQASDNQLKEIQEKLIIAEKNLAVLECQVHTLEKSLDDKSRQLQETTMIRPLSVDIPTDPETPGKCNTSGIMKREEVPQTPTVEQKSILKKLPPAFSDHSETMALIRKAEEKCNEVKRSKGTLTPIKPKASSPVSSSPEEKRRRFDTTAPKRLSLSRSTRSANVDVDEIAASPVIRAVATYSRKNKRGASKDRKSLN